TADIVLPLRMRDGDRELTFFSTVSTFGTAVDVTLAELSIEAFYPANASTAQRLLADIGVG
ncbi:MAG TPA: transcriptional regulator, partial [Solirubrobacteraceae bacterium]|nr:transcriptional regulator [Solirubrobacteraceae bacterium]